MKSILTIVVIALGFMSSTLYAGAAAEADPAVTIEFYTPDSGRAEGSMWLVRSSKNDVEIVGCSSKGALAGVDPLGRTKWAWCRARDATGEEVLCLTEDENLLDAIQAISPFSYISFEFENAVLTPNNQGGEYLRAECTRFDFSTQSHHLPLFTTTGKKAKR